MLSAFLHIAMQLHFLTMHAHVVLFSQGIVPMITPPFPGG